MQMVGDGRILDIVAEGLTLVEGELLINLTDTFGPLTVYISQSPTSTAQRNALVELYTSANGRAWSYAGTTYTEWGSNTSDPCVNVWVCIGGG